MNTENNQRFKDTEQKILEAYARLILSKGLGKITVADVCREGKIHRTTFYGHFADIIELEEYVAQKQYVDLWQGFFDSKGDFSFRQGMLKQVKLYYKYKDTIKKQIMLQQSSALTGAYNDFLSESSIKESYKKHFELETDTDVAYHHDFFISGFKSMIYSWILNGCKESPEEITDLLCNIFKV